MYPPQQPPQEPTPPQPRLYAPPPAYGQSPYGPPPQGYGYGPPPPHKGTPGWVWPVVFGCGIPALLGFVLFATIFAAAFNRGFGKGRERGRQLVCQRNLQEIATASAMYAQDYGATLPPPARWSETIRPYISRTGARDTAIRQLAIKVDADHPFRCPSRVDAPSKKTYGYAYNTAVAGQATAAIRTPITTPIYFDSDTMTKDASDAGTSLPKFGRHAGYNNIAYVDGHVRRLRAGAPDRSVGRGPAYPLGDDSDAP